MALDTEIKEQLAQYLELLENNIVLKASVGEDENSQKVLELVEEITSMSSKISMEKVQLEKTPSFAVDRPDGVSGVVFAGLPLGHEFTSLVLALLQVSGRAPKVDDKVIKQIQSINKDLHFETYVSLTCHNCPDVVQALNIMSVVNPRISHTMIEGGMFKEEVEAKGIMAVPTVMLNGEEFSSGRMTIEQILEKAAGPADASEFEDKDPYDVLVIGGGPAGASAAIYAARKGIRTGLVAETFGGQVLETLGIENVIGTPYTEGPKLMAQVEAHVNEYPVDIMKSQRTAKLEKKELVEVTLENGAVLKSKTAILATGARWRNVGVPGEKEFKNKGVAYCPHCDGPLFEGKDVAVIGGGNSGIEAAIDLAGIVKHVTVLEFMPELKADQVLQERLYSLPNVTVKKNVQTKEITGTDKVNGITYADRETGEEVHVEVQGVFVLIGLVPNTDWLGDTLDRTKMGEIIVDKHGATSVPGVFAAGDCTDSAYKQIIISMGSGATAALGAFDYMIRHT
ncbi:alkyl hydroperoxide reductase subunit F [Enterococcus sp. BWM-S5]|uniref:Alkyl hydroperoxide reductase subunit F n=1 Tax=Enterococcus larvae TaxID=2794352 RepID=A0ABS4CH90_9ENTE|nr:alkyl hydroperoxide reductase subunit F [Enterococcus larvae]MBP1045989.1 alkyl hydroperoxide reductase subunit F [Enterococcus larvae]